MITELKIIKTEEQYQSYLAEVEKLALEDPRPGTDAADRLELLSKLIEDFEEERYEFERPGPISAILFRMEEQGLRQKDIAPLLGGKNRASEVLSGKRPLTLTMVRALNEQLGIPAELLIQELEYEAVKEPLSHYRAPKRSSEQLAEMTLDWASGAVAEYLKPAQGPLYLRRTITYGATPQTNKANLHRWVNEVREIAAQTKDKRGPWKAGTVNEQFLSYVARLSYLSRGPKLAQEFLAEKGIALVLLRHLPKTKLDGAAMMDEDGAPIIGLTLRSNRLDSFWFTLLHELVHVWKHLPETEMAITDENVEDRGDEEDDAKEAEANRLARDAFIPKAIWKRSQAYLRPSTATIHALSEKLQISPAVIAGRLRREKTGYSYFSKLVGQGEVRKMFPEVHWD